MRFFSIFIMLACCIPCLSGHHYYVAQVAAGDQSGTSWANASGDLYDIISHAEPGDIIWVASGTYKGGFQWRNGVTVMGGFNVGDEDLSNRKLPSTGQNLTILDGDHKYRVLNQPYGYSQTSCFDGFVIRNGNAIDGAGVVMMKGAELRNCIIESCQGGLPSVGDVASSSSGIVYDVEPADNKIYIVSASNVGRLCQLERAEELLSSFSQGSYIWSMPTTDDLRRLSLSPGLEIVDQEIGTLGMDKLQGTRLWSSTNAESSDLEGVYIADLVNREIRPCNKWQYNFLRPVSSYISAPQSSRGGGINASYGAVINNCTVSSNSATYGSGIYARNQVVISNTELISNSGTDVLDVDDTVILENTTGIQAINSETGKVISENPIGAGQTLHILSPVFRWYEIYDFSGKLVSRGRLSSSSTITAPNVSGNYVLRLSDNQQHNKTIKLIVR